MNIFNYLKEDDKHLKQSVSEVAENYSEWTQDRVFESVKNAIESIQSHIDKKNDVLIANIHNKDMLGDALRKWDEQTFNIRELIDGLVMIHIDEPGFEQTLMRLSRMVENLVNLSNEELYPAARDAATAEELERINKHLKKAVLS